jgi:uncharacterized membrane protein
MSASPLGREITDNEDVQIDRRPITAVQALALLVAIGLSGYLTYLKATNGIPPCTAGGGCAAALYSDWGYLAGIPLAYIGLTASAVLLLASPWRVEALRMASLLALVVGALFTIYLRYVEQAYFDGSMCAWCVAFMAAWWVALGAEAWRLRRGRAPEPDAVA